MDGLGSLKSKGPDLPIAGMTALVALAFGVRRLRRVLVLVGPFNPDPLDGCGPEKVQSYRIPTIISSYRKLHTLYGSQYRTGILFLACKKTLIFFCSVAPQV